MTTEQSKDTSRDRGSIQLSESPRRSPLIVEPPSTPVRSVHVEGDEGVGFQSLADQKDFSHRTSDFFDAPSDDEIGATVYSSPPTQAPDGHRNVSAKLASSPQSPSTEHSIVLGEEPARRVLNRGQGQDVRELFPHQDNVAFEETPLHSLHDSVDEFLAQNQYNASQFPRGTDRPSGSSRIHLRPAPSSSKANQVLGAHLLAHEITLQALMRNRDVMEGEIHPFTPTDTATFRSSLLPPSLQVPEARETNNDSTSNSRHHGKKVHILPSRINTSTSRASFLKDFVPTPYPFGNDPIHSSKDKQRHHASKVSSSTRQRTLRITISNGRHCNVNPRWTILAIPAFNQFSTTREDRRGNPVLQPRPSFFDDEDLFDQLRLSFHRIRGRLHCFSARSLCRIVVIGPNGNRIDTQPQPFDPARSSISLASTAPAIALTEDGLLRHFRRPRLGRARYGFVRWAYQLADQAVDAANTSHEEGRDLADRESGLKETFPRLEFVVDWSVTRIVLVLSLVLVLSMLGALLWIFLGVNTPATWPPHAGFRGAGDRVGAGILVGIGVLLLGLSVLAGWLGVSYLVI